MFSSFHAPPSLPPFWAHLFPLPPYWNLLLLWALFLYFRLVCPPPPKTPTSESALLCWLMLLAAGPAGISSIADGATAAAAAAGCVDMSRVRRAVIHLKHYRDILTEDKLVEFRSCAVALRFVPGLLVLFCLGSRWRRRGMEAMLVAEVLEIVDLPCREACLRFPVEAGACKLSRMARSWKGGKVRCIVLSGARPATDYVNLSAGCLGFVGQFESTTGTPRFCHVSDLHKTMAVTLKSGLTVSSILKRSWPLTVNSNPRRSNTGGGGGGAEADVDVGHGCVTFDLIFKGTCAPNPFVGAAPYATAEVDMKGLKMTAQFMTVVGNGSCAYHAICATFHSLLKGKDTNILSEHLGVAEFTNANMIASIGKEIVECDRPASESVETELSCALKFRNLLANYFLQNKDKFHDHFKDKVPGGGPMPSGAGKGWTTVRALWSRHILTSDTLWDEDLFVILGRYLPSFSILQLCSTKPLLSGKGPLYFYDVDLGQALISTNEKIRIVLHFINPSSTRLRQPYKMRARAGESSDCNHYEHVLLEGGLKFHFPKMDDKSLNRLEAK